MNSRFSIPGLSSFLSVFYPQNCKCCGATLVRGEDLFCLTCELNFSQFLSQDFQGNEIEQLFWGKAKIETCFAPFQFLKQENLQHLIHEFKYNSNYSLADRLGKLLGEKSQHLFHDCDLISFVPMHKSKERKRGYNQGELLAKGVGSSLDKPVVDILIRTVRSDSQTDKGVYDRYQNMQNKFELDSCYLDVKHVLLVDDVITTGATLAACAKVLNSRGIKVSILCLAFRSLKH